MENKIEYAKIESFIREAMDKRLNIGATSASDYITIYNESNQYTLSFILNGNYIIILYRGHRIEISLTEKEFNQAKILFLDAKEYSENQLVDYITNYFYYNNNSVKDISDINYDDEQ